ncbi:MAG TPA: hypothetical protein VM598_13075 [Bdellovibrionota bacterium]|nr:hypothetical protein [Bdellovibrionota bacterium]
MDRNHSALFLTTTFALALASACAPQKTDWDDRAGAPRLELDDPAAGAEPPASCTSFLPNYLLDVRVASFEMLDEASLGLGFPATQIGSPIVDLDVKFAHGRMDLEIEARKPLASSGARSARGRASLNKFSVEAQVNLPALVLDPKYVYRTPIAEVAAKSIADGVKNLQTETSGLEWQSSVRAVVGERVVIDAGDLSGIKVGDQFAVHPVEHVWIGEACQGEYLGSVRDTAPSAVVEVESVAQLGTTSFAKVVSGDLAKVEVGADVVVKKLKTGVGPARSLKKSVRLGTVSVEGITLPDGSSLSLETAMKVLARDVLLRSSYWPKY